MDGVSLGPSVVLVDGVLLGPSDGLVDGVSVVAASVGTLDRVTLGLSVGLVNEVSLASVGTLDGLVDEHSKGFPSFLAHINNKFPFGSRHKLIVFLPFFSFS